MKKSETAIRVHVTNQDGELLNSIEFDLVKIEKVIEKASSKRGAIDVLIARDLAFIGDDAGEMVGDEVRAALKRRALAKGKR